MKHGKVLQFDYDFITSKDNIDVLATCFTYAERQILLSMIDYIGWSTRWHSPTGQTIDQDEIDLFRDNIARKLMLEDCGMDCDDVVACLTDDIDNYGDFIQALIAWLNQNIGEIDPGGGKTDTGSIDDIYNNLIDGIGCNKDNVFGFTLQLVKFLNQIIEDAFEKLEALGNAIEYMSLVADFCPYLAPFLDMIDLLGETVAENYLANYDASYENELACELLCLAMTNNCKLSFEDLMNVLASRVYYAWQNLSPVTVFGYITTGTWSGTEYCDVGMFVAAYVLQKGASWGGVSLQLLQRFMESFLNDPNSDWSVLCDCGWIKLYPFSVDDLGNWVVDQGQWANSYAAYSTIETYNEVRISHDYSGFDGLKTVRVLRGWDQVSQTGEGIQIKVVHGGGTAVHSLNIGAAAKQWVEKVYPTALNNVTEVEIIVRDNSVPEGGSTSIDVIRLEGTGNNPPAN